MHPGHSRRCWWRWWLRGSSLEPAPLPKAGCLWGAASSPACSGQSHLLVWGHRGNLVCFLHAHHLLLKPCSQRQGEGTKGHSADMEVPPAGSTCCYLCVCVCKVHVRVQN